MTTAAESQRSATQSECVRSTESTTDRDPRTVGDFGDVCMKEKKH